MSKAKKVKQIRLKPFEKLLTVMISGKPVARDEIETLLGNEIYMYRLSTYIWHIKTHANGVVKAIKDGRKVTAYQLMNVADVKKYMDRLECKLNMQKSLVTPLLTGVLSFEKSVQMPHSSFLSRISNSQLSTIDISYFVKEAIRLIRDPVTDPFELLFLNSLWDRFSNSMSFSKEGIEHMIPIVDISSSMNESNMMPYYNALGIACMIAQHSSLKNRILTIDHQPSWIVLDDCPDFVSKIRKIIGSSHCGTCSHLFESIDLILQSILVTHMTPEQVRSLRFVILSDMKHIEKETHSIIKQLFHDVGLKSIYNMPFLVPHILYWNLSTHWVEYLPCLYNTPRISLVSGSSWSVLNDFCLFGSSSYVDDLFFTYPYNTIHTILQFYPFSSTF
jgi:hypothetical protein